MRLLLRAFLKRGGNKNFLDLCIHFDFLINFYFAEVSTLPFSITKQCFCHLKEALNLIVFINPYVFLSRTNERLNSSVISL